MKVLLLYRTYANPSHISSSVKGNQVAIKYIKNPGTSNFQKPSIMGELTAVKCFILFKSCLLDVSFKLNVVIVFAFGFLIDERDEA